MNIGWQERLLETDGAGFGKEGLDVRREGIACDEGETGNKAWPLALQSTVEIETVHVWQANITQHCVKLLRQRTVETNASVGSDVGAVTLGVENFAQHLGNLGLVLNDKHA